MIYYLDTSFALQAVFPTPDRDRLISWFDDKQFISSRLLRTEVIRALRREARPLTDADWVFDRIGLIDITRATHNQAEAIERHTKTLDALHLATALSLDFPVTIATADTAMRDLANALGFTTISLTEAIT